MYKIICGCADCAHNTAGGCDAGTVNVREKAGEGAPKCLTFTHWYDAENTVSEISPLGFRGNAARGWIACAASECDHMKNGLCEAESVVMEPSSPGGNVWCLTYKRG